MDLRQRFVTELRRLGRGRVLDLTPSEMAAAARSVLHLDAAGIVMTRRLVRLPVGATGEDARTAERIQATLGDGPCLTATATGVAQAVEEAEMASRWPLYHERLVLETSLRSVVALPLKDRHGVPFAALDLLGVGERLDLPDELSTIQAAVADLVGMLLLRVLSSENELPYGPGAEGVRRRQNVWVAVGMVLQAAKVSDDDAMAILRGYAFSQELTIDEVAMQLLTGAVSAEAVIAV